MDSYAVDKRDLRNYGGSCSEQSGQRRFSCSDQNSRSAASRAQWPFRFLDGKSVQPILMRTAISFAACSLNSFASFAIAPRIRQKLVRPSPGLAGFISLENRQLFRLPQ